MALEYLFLGRGKYLRGIDLFPENLVFFLPLSWRGILGSTNLFWDKENANDVGVSEPHGGLLSLSISLFEFKSYTMETTYDILK